MNDGDKQYLAQFAARLGTKIRALERTSLGFSRARLTVFLIGAAVCTLAFQHLSSGQAWLTLGATLAIFVGLTRQHDRVHQALRRHRIYQSIKLRHIARIERDWAGLGSDLVGRVGEDHPFAHDLDLLGDRSLHHLLDTSFSEGGGGRLANWLTEPSPDPERVLSRQLLVRELVPRAAFRDRIALLSRVTGGASSASRFDGDILIQWLARRNESARMKPLLTILWVLAGLNAAFVATHVAGLTGPWWSFSLTAYAAIYVLNGRLYAHLFDEAEHLQAELERFRPVVLRLEAHRFPESSELRRHLAPFQSADRPSLHLRRIARLALAASAQKSEILRLLANVAVPWDLHFAYRLAKEKEALRELVPLWLDRVYDLEAAGSLATYAHLNPGAIFPVIKVDATEPVLQAEGLAHPLLHPDKAVRNSIEFRRTPHLTLVTGSNMSGKSTFLRALGTAQVMAMGGGPVEAESFQTSPFVLHTSMGIHDSLADGISFFYAEVRRLGRIRKSVAEGPGPFLVLIDEIFRGTNNRERLLGSKALLRSMADENCIGLVATHDLELVSLGEELEAFDNRHFREEVSGGRMIFDYLMREGPCPTTNALKIMAAEGLPVPDTDEGRPSV